MTQKPSSTLSNAIAFALCSAGVFWGCSIPQPLIGVGVSWASVAALGAHKQKNKWEIKPLLGECVSSAMPLLESTASALTATGGTAEAGPITKFGHRFLAKLTGDRPPGAFDWFNNMAFGLGSADLLPYGVWLICGEQREGKSIVARYMAAQYIEQHPGCFTAVCDIEAQSHEDPNAYWFHIPYGATTEEIVKTFRKVRVYLDTAKGDGSDPGLMITFDEVASTLMALGDKQREYIINCLRDCHLKGAKRKVLVLCIMHSLMGNVLNWPGISDFAPRANIVMLQKFANDDANFRNLQASKSLVEVRGAIALEEIVPMASGAPRPCLLYVDKKWSLRWVPTIEEIELTVLEDEPAATDPYANIRPFLPDRSEVTLPSEELSLNKFLALLRMTSSIHKSREHPYLAEWKMLLEDHNQKFRSNR